MSIPSLYRIPGDRRSRLNQMRSTCAGSEPVLRVVAALALAALVVAGIGPWKTGGDLSALPLWPCAALVVLAPALAAAWANKRAAQRRYPFLLSHLPLDGPRP